MAPEVLREQQVLRREAKGHHGRVRAHRAPLAADHDVDRAVGLAVQALVDLGERVTPNALGELRARREVRVERVAEGEVVAGEVRHRVRVPRRAEQAVRVRNVGEVRCVRKHGRVGPTALGDDVVRVGGRGHTEPLVQEDDRVLPATALVEDGILRVLPVRHADGGVHGLERLLELEGERKVVRHDAGVIVPVIAVLGGRAMQVLLHEVVHVVIPGTVLCLAVFTAQVVQSAQSVEEPVAVLVGQGTNFAAHILAHDRGVVQGDGRAAV
mmetsp:Transcript_71639/g.202494  ORF Transcript_71639/g.202494 Transcript_71639/m.202494 type:complete len:269 (-) Transcript_71639:640-1446(-)